MDRLKSWIQLKNAPDVGYQTAAKLTETFGEPSFWDASILQQAYEQKYIQRTTLDWLTARQDPSGWQGICKYLDKYDISYCTYLDADYPAQLKNIYAPPLILYYRGNLQTALRDWNLGVVGTRKPSPYGKSMTEMLVETIAQAGVGIISGFAYGIDTAAHTAALKANGYTIGVLAHGLEQIYPPQNRELADRVLDKGALVSEYEPGCKIEAWNFPTRNRIISALSHGVWVVEGNITSGALLTAKYAIEQNRELYALPGQINIPNAQGPNHLIKNGAKLVTNAEDILNDFDLNQTVPEQTDLFPVLSQNEQTIYSLFQSEQRELGFDDLLMQTGLAIGQLSIVLLNLELKGLLIKTHGSLFALR